MTPPKNTRCLKPPVIYLASRSERRQRLLKAYGIPFKRIASSFEEKVSGSWGPARCAMANAEGKARRARFGTGKVIIGADTLIYLQGKMIGKPSGFPDALEMLKRFSGRGHWVYTGVCVRDGRTGRSLVFYEKTRVVFKRLSDRRIRTYLAKGEYKDKAGAYGYQGLGRSLVKRIRGSETNVIGLPMEKLTAALRGMSLLQPL